MVFDGEQYEGNNRNALNRFQALRAASAVKILGKGVIKVVHRVDDAKENNNLGKKKNGIYVQCLTSSPANLPKNFQIHFSLELMGGLDQTQFLMKA